MNAIETLQKLMIKHSLYAYVIPTADFHQSEYVSAHFKSREYLSGFTGSAGTLVVTPYKAYLWVDGRYFIQAENETKDTQISLMKIGQPGVPTIIDFLKDILKGNLKLGFDAKTISASEYMNYQKIIGQNNIVDIDLVSGIWLNRPRLPFSMLYSLPEYIIGESSSSKILKIREKLKECRAKLHILTSLEDQAWLFNLRADDVSHTPVFLSYTIVTLSEVYLFIDKNKLNPSVSKILEDLKVNVLDYEDIYDFLHSITGNTVMLDPNKVNAKIYNNIADKNTIIFRQNPTILLKAIKNPIEIKNTKIAHEHDGVAITKLMRYLKTRAGLEEMTELSVSDYLEKLRRSNKNLIDLSFNTICAYNANAAMMHYSATPLNNSVIHNSGMLLIDSGGHYLQGSTDITRTISMGNPTNEEKKYFTTVLKSMINLSDTIFIHGCTGQNLDIKARGPIWKLGIDYKCGTGHGIGHILSVHEAPNGFRWQIVPERLDSSVLLPGMITTNEPGIYLEGKLGIRIENELLCVPHIQNEWGTFYKFETITYAPIDLDLIDSSLLDSDEINWLNDYHESVYQKLQSYLSEDEREWLRYYTRKI